MPDSVPSRMVWHEAMAKIGPFENVIQIAPSRTMHDLLQMENAEREEQEANGLISEGPAEPPSLAGGNLSYHGGPTIGSAAKLYNVYLGTLDFDTVDFDAFTKAVVENGYYLSPDSKDATSGKFIGSQKVAWPFSALTVDDSTIASWVDTMVATGKFPVQDGSTMYSLIFPKGTIVTAFGSASCSSFCGYHTMSRSDNYYQVINDTSCSGCNTGVANDGRMMVQAHEYTEWRSDPQGDGWYNDGNKQENADECAWNRIPWGPDGKGWVVQPFWVNNVGCYTGAYVAPTPPPPPPPPPPPVPVAVTMRVTKQPTTATVGVISNTWSVGLYDSSGLPVPTDNSTVVTATLKNAANIDFANKVSVKAVNGVVTFPGMVFQNAHPLTEGLNWLLSSGTMNGVRTDKFAVLPKDVPVPPPPPPPPPPPVTKYITAVKTEFIAPDRGILTVYYNDSSTKVVDF